MSLQATHMRLPLSLDEVTPEWLTQALGTRFPGIAVASVTRDGERAGTSTSAQFALTYADRGDGADVPETIYVKGGFDPVMRKRVWAALIQEARFYAELGADVPVRIPTAYFAGIDEEQKQGIIILEDMAARGVRFGHITKPLSLDTIAATVEGLAALHGKFWNDRRLAGYREWAEPQRAFFRYLYREKHWDAVHERPYADMIRKILPTRAFALQALEHLWATNDAGCQTFLHGDCHSGNLYYEPDGAPGFMDWQLCFPGNPGHDLSENLLTSLSVEDRRANERRLIDLYHGVLAATAASDVPSADEIFLYYRRNAMHNMVTAVFNPYDMQTVEVTDASAIRCLHAAADLDMIEALAL